MVKILIIGPVGTTRTTHAKDLERDGYRVLTADTKPEGLASLESICPDLVVLEADLPGMGDSEALDRLIARSPRIPVLMVAAGEDEMARDTADACVEQSGDTRMLRRTVRQLLNPHAA